MRSISASTAADQAVVPKPASKSLATLLDDAARVEQQLLDFAETHYGEVNEEFENMLNEIGKDVEKKIDSVHFVCDRLQTSAQMLKDRAKQFTSAGSALENARERIRERVKGIMVATSKHEMKGVNWRFKLVSSNASIEYRIDEIPETYKKPVTEWQVDKEAVKAAVKKGEKIPGVVVTPSMALRSFVNKGD